MEAPGALLILFLFILFPLLNLVALGLKYSCSYYLHQVQLREAALLPASLANSAAGAVKRGLPQQWKNSGLGSFVDMVQELPETAIRYEKGEVAANGVHERVVVLSSRFQLRPFLSVATPGLPELPGLNQPFTYSFESKRLLENPANAEL